MSNPNAMMRTILRWAHLLVGFLIGAFVYTPARDSEAYVLLMQAAVVPAVTLTGVAGPHPPPVPPPPELRAPQKSGSRTPEGTRGGASAFDSYLTQLDKETSVTGRSTEIAKTIVGRGGSVFGAGGGRWIVGVLAVAGTLVMAHALSPGLRADLDGLGIVAASLGGTYAAVVKDVVLSFGILSLPAVGTARVHRTRAPARLERNTSGRFRPRNREARQTY